MLKIQNCGRHKYQLIKNYLIQKDPAYLKDFLFKLKGILEMENNIALVQLNDLE